jgi:NADH:ubiquinone oxidoreductase subunit K
MMFVLVGVISGSRVEGHLFGLFVTVMGIAQLAGGYALSVRLFYLKNRNSLDDMQVLKR